MQLGTLLTEAQEAPLHERILWRDQIAAYGDRAIDAVAPWLAAPDLAAFAVRVIERAGEQSDPAHATRILRAARKEACAPIQGDIDWALARLRVLARA